jgi:hypothetical protein
VVEVVAGIQCNLKEVLEEVEQVDLIVQELLEQ